jgi:DNA-directed RNA polymerase specialized sigma24 family protein
MHPGHDSGHDGRRVSPARAAPGALTTPPEEPMQRPHAHNTSEQPKHTPPSGRPDPDALERACRMAGSIARRHARHAQEREELRAEALRAWCECRERFADDGRGTLETFAWQRMDGRVRDVQRAAWRAARREASYESEPRPKAPGETPLAVRVDVLRLLSSERNPLSSEEQALVEAVYWQGMKVSAWARETGCDLRRAWRLHARALRLLGAALRPAAATTRTPGTSDRQLDPAQPDTAA